MTPTAAHSGIHLAIYCQCRMKTPIYGSSGGSMKRWFLTAGALLLAPVLDAQSTEIGVQSKKLANGLEVMVIETHAVPIVTIELDVKNGAYTEGPEFSGLSHLYEHMFFKANKTIPSQEKYLRRLNQLGAQWNGTTSEERVNYF